MRLGVACDCTEVNTGAADYCFLDLGPGNVPIGKIVSSADFLGVTADAPVPFGGQLTFSPVRPTMISGNGTFTAASIGQSVRVLTSIMGRVRMCSPVVDGKHLKSYPAC